MKTKAGLLLITAALTMGACNRNAPSNAANATVATTPAANVAAPTATANGKAAPAPAAQAAGLALDGEGLRAVDPGNGHTSPLEFGVSLDDTVGRIGTILGSRPTSDSVNGDCGAGPTRIVQFANGLKLLGQNNSFQGWEVDHAGLGTMDGINVGVTRARIDQNQGQIEQTTLGTEFSMGDGETAIRGLLSSRGADGRVTALWAGLTCHMT